MLSAIIGGKRKNPFIDDEVECSDMEDDEDDDDTSLGGDFIDDDEIFQSVVEHVDEDYPEHTIPTQSNAEEEVDTGLRVADPKKIIDNITNVSILVCSCVFVMC